MSESRLIEMQRRMIWNLTTLGFGMIAAGPLAWFFAPMGFVLGPVFLVLGILSLIRASMLRDKIR